MTAKQDQPASPPAAPPAGLVQVQELISRCLCSEAPLLADIPRYLLGLGGKRVRPALVLLTARLLGAPVPSPEIITVSAAIELVHMATLLHDDIIDRSVMRRRSQSPLAKYGAEATLLAGDFLLVRAFGLCARLDAFVIESAEAACVALTEGEILETALYEDSHTIDSALLICRKKTAALFSFAARAAGHLCGANGRRLSALEEFGENLGTAFQIADDIRDITATEDSLGKQAGTDIRERKPSVVNVLWLESGDALARKLLTPPQADAEVFVQQALEHLRASPVIEEARALAFRFGEQARLALESIAGAVKSVDAREALRALQGLLDHTLARSV